MLKYFSYFSEKIGFGISCKLSPKETICMKCLSIFSQKNKKNTTNLSSAEFAQSGSDITVLMAFLRR